MNEQELIQGDTPEVVDNSVEVEEVSDGVESN
jgi:hypothetical protein